MQIVLLRNYALDDQPSMHRFADQLQEGLRGRGVHVDVLEPPAIVGGASSDDATVGKWIRYVDKYLLFPPRLRRALGRRGRKDLIVHVCDHSNAVYVPRDGRVPHLVTCHDLLAVRAARGECPPVRTGWTGRQLQAAIRRGLGRAGQIACDSAATADDVLRIVGTPAERVSVVAPAVSRVFRQGDEADRRVRASQLIGTPEPGGASPPYLLHVGGNQWYKNRAGVIDIYAALVRQLPHAPRLVMAGKPLTNDLLASIDTHGLRDRIVSVCNVSDEELASLYSCAELLLFPSVAEGFGWPVIEAMACGCRVVASGRAPITELAADAAAYVDPSDVRASAETVARVLAEPVSERRPHVARGLARAARFSEAALVDGYLLAYRRLLDRWHERAA